MESLYTNKIKVIDRNVQLVEIKQPIVDSRCQHLPEFIPNGNSAGRVVHDR